MVTVRGPLLLFSGMTLNIHKPSSYPEDRVAERQLHDILTLLEAILVQEHGTNGRCTANEALRMGLVQDKPK